MVKKKFLHKKVIGGIIGFVLSIILLVLTVISYHTNTVNTLLGNTPTTFSFKLFAVLYSWPFIIVAWLFSRVNITLSSPLLLFLISSGTYTLLGYALTNARQKKRRKRKK